MRVLLVEDDPHTSRSIELMLKQSDLKVHSADLGEEGIELAKLYLFDVILLDLTLPDLSGQEVLRRLRRARVSTPVLILSGDDAMESKIASLNQGADDYLTKPFHWKELVARIHALVRRSRGHAHPVIQIGRINVDLETKTVDVSGQPVRLTSKEYRIVELLALRKGTTLSKEMFLNHLYDSLDEPDVKIIDVFICKLRKKLALANDGNSHIETVWGRGYVLRDPMPIPRPQIGHLSTAA